MQRGSGGVPRKVVGRSKAGEWKTSRNGGRGEAALGSASMASRGSTSSGSEAVVFSIQFYGKTIGEVGLLDQDLSELDWTKFKSYIFQNLLSVNHQENICVSYSDDEGDKLPIESEEEYREALKVAKKKAEAHDKLVLDITRQGSLPTVFSIVSSGIKRVSSSPPKEGGISFFKTASPPKESTSFGGRSDGQDKRSFPSLFSTDRGDGEASSGGTRPKESGNQDQPPKWFTTYMNKFHEDLCEDVVTKLAHLIREELAITPKADQEKTQECPEGKGIASPLALVDSRTPVESDMEKHAELNNTLRNLFSTQKLACKNLRAEGDTQKHSSSPTQLKVTHPSAYECPEGNGIASPLALVDSRTPGVESDLEKRAELDNTLRNLFSTHKFACKNLRAEGDTQKPSAYGYIYPKSGHLKNDSVAPLELYVARRNQRKSSHPQKRSSFQLEKSNLKERRSGMEKCAMKKEENGKDNIERKGIKLLFNNPQKRSSFQITFTEGKESSDEKSQDLKSYFKNKNGDAKENMKGSDGGVKRKKNGKDEERINKLLERMEEQMAKKQGKMEERFAKKHEKLEERLMKKQEKLTERFQKQQEKAEKRKSTSIRLLEIEKSNRTQGKVLAKMEGLRKKQACTPEELNKLRKVVDKHHRAADKHDNGTLTEQRYLRSSDRKAGKSRKININRKAYPVDASFLRSALLELETLPEDSATEILESASLGYEALYVEDITYPDGSHVPLGAQFVKTWRVLNAGFKPWNEDTEVCRLTQVEFQGSPVDLKLKPLEEKMVCPPLKPGECGNISITFIAPDKPGLYATYWRFCQQGRVFGNQIWCTVYVTSNANSDTESQTKVAVDNSDSDGAQGAEGTSTEEENEEKECEEQSSSDEQSSSEEDVPNFMDAAKDMHDTENATAEGSANAPSNDILDPEAEPDSDEGEAGQQSEYEVGIIENYYDAEDSTEEDTQKCVDASGQESASGHEVTAEPNEDLISFEEEAELVPSGSASPNEAHSDSVVVHSVMPLKDMARESVDTLNFLKDSFVVQNEDESQDPMEGNALDEFSFSSGSFSDLDSEDQAILNESDTDVSDQDYFVVTMPECFDLTLPYSSVAESSQQGAPHGITNSVPEAERPDSPDFLTADEDDRVTTAANKKYQEELAASTRSSADNNEASSHSGSVLENTRMTDAKEERHQGTQGSRNSGDNMPSLPLPPTETRGFMDIPSEALRTNSAINLYKENSTRPEAKQQPKHQESSRANWGLGADERQQVVCEQPVSAQMKAGASPQSQSKPSPLTGGMAESNTSQGVAVGNMPEQGSVDGAAAALPDERASIIPDELVSIIPEDLVRGVWNTARTFITLINQEMHSPSANGPASIGDGEGAAAAPTPPCPTQEPPQKEERRKESPQAATPEAGDEPPSLPPPLQQLADMGFSNHEMNQCLLTKYNNDVACAVAELIVLNCQ